MTKHRVSSHDVRHELVPQVDRVYANTPAHSKLRAFLVSLAIWEGEAGKWFDGLNSGLPYEFLDSFAHTVMSVRGRDPGFGKYGLPGYMKGCHFHEHGVDGKGVCYLKKCGNGV